MCYTPAAQRNPQDALSNMIHVVRFSLFFLFYCVALDGNLSINKGMSGVVLSGARHADMIFSYYAL